MVASREESALDLSDSLSVAFNLPDFGNFILDRRFGRLEVIIVENDDFYRPLVLLSGFPHTDTASRAFHSDTTRNISRLLPVHAHYERQRRGERPKLSSRCHVLVSRAPSRHSTYRVSTGV